MYCQFYKLNLYIKNLIETGIFATIRKEARQARLPAVYVKMLNIFVRFWWTSYWETQIALHYRELLVANQLLPPSLTYLPLRTGEPRRLGILKRYYCLIVFWSTLTHSLPPAAMLLWLRFPFAWAWVGRLLVATFLRRSARTCGSNVRVQANALVRADQWALVIRWLWPPCLVTVL